LKKILKPSPFVSPLVINLKLLSPQVGFDMTDKEIR